MGRIIKGTGRVVPVEVMTAREQAAQMLADAHAEAARVQGQTEALRERTRAEGFAAGHEAGRQAAAAEATELLVAARIDADRTRELGREPAATLARRMAERIVGRTLTFAPALMADIVAQTLAASRAQTGAVVLRVHPEDLAAIEAARARWAVQVPDTVQLRVVADAAVGRHGCVVDTPVGRLDARLDTQLAALEKAIVGG